MELIPATPDGIPRALEILQAGGVVAHATETCYGLACDLSNEKAVANLFAIKKRPDTQPVSALFASIEDAKVYVEWNDQAEKLAREQLPGPLTIVLKIRQDAPKTLYPTPSGGETIGVRISSHPLAQELVSRFGSPISTTSANLHGEPNPYAAREIEDQFVAMGLRPDAIVNSGMLERRKSSTVIDLSGGGRMILRA